MWDTAGQERYDSLTQLYFKGAEAAIIVFDITDDKSFEKARSWVSKLNDCKDNSNSIITVLVGNKSDLIDN